MSLSWDSMSLQMKRKLLFTPCETKEALQNWIRQFLGYDLPDCTVDPSSNSSPMSLVWEIYDKALKNDDPDFSTVLAYASRESMKTLVTAVLEVLCLLHLGRSVVHLAAILDQAKKAQGYVRDLFFRPVMRDFLALDNDRNKSVVRWESKETGEILNEKEFRNLSDADPKKEHFVQHKYDIVIVVATLQSVNGQHAPFMCVDEIDVMTDMRVYNESKMIPTPFAGKSPITLLTSSRKFSYGIVQKEIDNAENTGTHVRHWNLIDVTQRCPESRHRPDLPILNVYVNNDTLTTVTEADYKTFSSDQKEKHVPDKAYSGCMSNCKIFAQCRGRLARKPPDPVHKAATMLKPISHVQNSFKKVDLDMAKAQLLCWKPSTTGLIYQYFDREIHMVTPAQMAEMITGEPQNPNLTKPQLVLSLIANGGMRFVAGIDWGFTHNFSCVLAAIDGQRAFIIEVISQAELETGDQIEIVKERIGKFNPKIYADSEDPQAISTFRKKGFKISPVQKGPGSVVAGIGVVRAALRDAAGSPPRLYLLKGDEGCAFLAKQMGIYHWKTDASGRVSDVPDHEASDENDALRYLMMSVFGKFGKVSAAKESTPVPTQPQAQNWMQSAIDTALGRDGTGPIVDLTGGSARGGVQKKGNLLWDFGGE